MSWHVVAIFAPLVLPALGAVVMAVLGSRAPRLTRVVALAATGLAFVAALPLAALTAPWPVSQPGQRLILVFSPWTLDPLPRLGITFLVDAVSTSFLLVILLTATASQLSSFASYSGCDGAAGTMAGELLLIAAGVAFVLAGDPLTLYLAWALMDLALFAITYAHAGQSNLDEPVRTLGVGVILGLPLLILGVISRPGTSWDQSSGTRWPAVSLVGLMFVAGARLGVYPVPFRPAVPELRAALRRPLTTLLPVTGGAYLVLRTILLGEGQVPGDVFWTTVGVLAVAVGGFLAWSHRDLRRGLGWVVVAQAGLLLVATGLGRVAGAVAGLQAFTLCLASALMCLWLESQRAFEQRSGFWMRGLGWLAVANLLGIPPTVGFVARWALYRHLVDAGAWPLVILLAVATAWTVPPLLRLMSTTAKGRKSRIQSAPTLSRLRPSAETAGVNLVGVVLLLVGLQPLLLLAPLQVLASPAYGYLSQVIRSVSRFQGLELAGLLVLPLLGGYALAAQEATPGRITARMGGLRYQLGAVLSMEWTYRAMEKGAWRVGTIVRTLVAPLEGERYWGWTFLYALLVALLLLAR